MGIVTSERRGGEIVDEDTAEARCERCGRPVGSGARRVRFSARRVDGDLAYRGRRIERTVCALCADTLAEAFLETGGLA